MILEFKVLRELKGALNDPEGVVPSVMARAVKAGAERFTEMVLEYIEGGHAFTSRTGTLEGSISWRPVDGASCEVYANAEYARWVEEGTYPHVIEARRRKALKIPHDNEGYVLRRRVMHPGSRPYPFMFADMQKRTESVIEAMRDEIIKGFSGTGDYNG